MADATKHLSINGGGGGTLFSELKSLFSLFKTRRSVAFAYGFMFVFVAFTAFLAFSPSSNSSSPWFTNVFTTSSITTASTDSNRSQFSSIFSYFFPNNTSSSPQQAHNFTTTRSNNTSTQSLDAKREPTNRQNHTQNIDNSDESIVLHDNHTALVNKKPSSETNFTQTAKTNQTSTVATPETPVSNQRTNSITPETPVSNQNTNSTTPETPVSIQNANSSSLVKEKSGNGLKSGAEKAVNSNYTAALSKNQSNGAKETKQSNGTEETKQSNGTNSGVLVKQGIENMMETLMNCDLFDGEWVHDDSYPLYKPGSCSFIDQQFSCARNGRPDRDYMKMKWKPKGCTLPRLDGAHMLELLRGKRLVFVGDSLNRNMWESLVCILRSSAKDPRKVFEANGRSHFRGEASYSFIFKDYNSSVEFFVSPFLVREWEMPDKNGKKKETLRLDLIGKLSDQYKGADILIFNTGHWWTHEKTSKGKDYYQEGSHVYNELNVLEAFRKAITTWARWIDANVNPMKSMVYFRGYSMTHFSGGQWNSGGACDNETEPIKNEKYLTPYPRKMQVLESVLKGMKTHVTYLNVTRLTDYRKDGHPSIYRWRSKSDLMYQDCSHWCLPGVPDAWNELFYAELLIKQNKMLQHQNQKRYR